MIPPVYTEAWQQWLQEQIAERVSYCEVQRQRIYFSPNGNDVSGNGTLEAPYVSLDKAQQLLNQSNGYLELYFLPGRYENHTRLDTTKPFVKIMSSEQKAIFDSFRRLTGPFQQYPTDRSRWFIDNIDSVVWVKEQDRLDPYIQVHYESEVESYDGSFYYDPDRRRLYFNPKGDVDPNNTSIVYQYNQPSYACFVLRGDGSVLENLVVIGYGMQFTTPSQEHGIDIRTNLGKQVVVSNCEAYYGSSHAMVTAAGGNTGGITTFLNCSAGYTMYNGPAGETIFNTYAYNGWQNTFFINCSVPYGTLPSYEWEWYSSNRGRGFFGHTGGGSFKSDLIVMYNCTTRKCQNPSSFNDLPNAQNLEDVRCFIVGDNFIGDGNGLAVFSNNTVRYASKYVCDPVDSGGLANWAQNGWFVNSAIDINLAGVRNRFSLYNGLFGNNSSPHAYNSIFYFRNGMYRNPISFDYDLNQTFDGIIANSIIHVAFPGTFSFGANISYINNAYSNIPNGNGPQINYTVFDRPECSSSLVGWFLELPLENDIEGPTLCRQSIGPWETWGCADYNKDGSVDFFDYLDFVSDWPDINSDGSIDFFDYLDFVSYWNNGCPQ